MDELPGFEEYLYVSEFNLPIEYIVYADYLVLPSSYKTIIEDYKTGAIRLDTREITVFELRDLLFAFTYRNYENDLNPLIESLVDLDEGLKQELNLDSSEKVQNSYDNWIITYEKLLLLTEKRANVIEDDINKLDYFESEYTISEPSVDTSHFESFIDVSDQIIDLTALFDTFQVSEHFPALWYPTKKLFKIHSSYKGNANFTTDSMKRETLYVLYGNKTAEIHVDEDRFKITIILMGKTDREELLSVFKFFPFKLDSLHENRAILTYQINFEYPVSVNINSFLYDFMLNGLFSRYFHIMESNSLSTTNYIRLRYIFPFVGTESEVIAFQLRGNRTFEATGGSKSRLSTTQSLEGGDEFIEIRIQALSHELVINYVRIIAKFIAYYLRGQERVNTIVSQFIEENEPLINPKTRSTLSRRSESASVKTSLSRSARYVESYAEEPLKSYFISGEKAIKEIREHVELPDDYSRQCSRNRQPRVINPELVEKFNKEKFAVNGVVYNRLALPFQTGNSTVYLGCPNDEFPFIGIRSTRGNQIIPCCYGEDQNIEGKHLYNYLKGTGVSINRFFSPASLQSLNILPPGTTGILPDSLKGLFEAFDPQKNFLRYGSVGGLQTFLHSILLARDDEYANLAKRTGSVRNTDLENYVMALRVNIANEVSDAELNPIKESLPDASYEDIRNILLYEGSYIDPKIFIAFFEYYFKIRLLVLKMDEEKRINLVQPDYMIFRGAYPVAYKDDPTPSLDKHHEAFNVPMVVIFGQDNTRVSVPQWELIVHQDKRIDSEERKKGFLQVIFEGDVADRLTMFFLDKVPTYQLYFNREESTMYLADRMWFNVNAFLRKLSHINKIELRGQSIDTLGKTRVLYFNFFSLIIPPITPLAIRVVEDEPYNKNNSRHIEVLSRLLGQVLNVYRDSKGLYWRVDWAPDANSSEMKISYLYKPISEFKRPYINLINAEIESFQTVPLWRQIAYYRKTSKRLHRLLCYLFLKYMQQENYIRINNVSNLLEEWKDSIEIDEDAAYDFSSLYGTYPQGEYIDVIERLRSTGLIHETKDTIILPSEKVLFNLYSYIKRWCLNRENMFIDTIYQIEIEGFYEVSSDFKQWNNARVYVGDNAIKAYLAERRNTAPPEVVKGPFRKISLLYPVDRWEYAAQRSVSWQRQKINSFYPSRSIPAMGKMTEAELKRSVGTTDTSDLLHYIEDQAPGRGIARTIYKAIIPFVDDVD